MKFFIGYNDDGHLYLKGIDVKNPNEEIYLEEYRKDKRFCILSTCRK